MQVNDVCAYFLPDGSYIQVRSGFSVLSGEKWMDVAIKKPNGGEEMLCAVDFDPEKGLRTLVYDDEHEEPVYVRENGYKQRGGAGENRLVEDGPAHHP